MADDARHPMPAPLPEESTDATFAFVDLAGFTAMTQMHGDARAVAVIRSFQRRVLDVLADDELVKTIGDAVMLRFTSAERAVDVLTSLLESELCHGEHGLLPRMGAHSGPAVTIDGDYLGNTVNTAARVADHARGGQLLGTATVALAARDLGALVRHIGPVALHNLREPLDIYEIHVLADTPYAVDPVCKMRVPLDGESIILDWQGSSYHFCALHCVARFATSPSTFTTTAERDQTAT